jgi:hypothetical protein
MVAGDLSHIEENHGGHRDTEGISENDRGAG